MREWQAEVLEMLNVLDDQGHFKKNVYSLSGFARLMIVQGSSSSLETLRKFFRDLRDVGVLVSRGERRVQGSQVVETFCFDGSRALDFFASDFESTSMYRLVKRYATLFFD